MLVACFPHQIDAGNHAEHHFCGIHKPADAAHALNNNQPAQLHLDGATGIFQKQYRENPQDSGVQKS